MVEIIRSNYATCDECHRRAAVLVDLGQFDPRGNPLYESGATICRDCLCRALALVDALDETADKQVVAGNEPDGLY